MRTLKVSDGSAASSRRPTYTLSPSSFAFAWEECRCCFYLDALGKLKRPRPPMPKIFNVIDDEMKNSFTGNRLELPGLPSGVVGHPELWVASTPIEIPGHASRCMIRGRLDNVIRFDDGTYGVLDRKTCSVRDEHVPLYGRQLHAYACALENPASSRTGLRPISRLGLLVFEPESFSYPEDQGSIASLSGPVCWVGVTRDDAAFVRFLGEVLDVLELPTPPAAAQGCQWCNYRNHA